MAKILALDSTSKSIVAYTTSASGAAIDYVTTWGDATSSTFVEGSSDGQITSSTPATIIAAPASSTRRIIKTINLYNAGSYSEIVTLAVVNGANTRIVYKITIAPGVTWTSDDLTTYTSSISSTVVSFRNVLVNGDFQISQRTPPVSMVAPVSGIANEYTSTSDFAPFSGSYTHDRWMILHQLANAGGWKVSRRLKTTAANVPSTQESSCGIASTATTTTLSKVGLAQIVEASNCVGLIGSPATLSFWAKRDSTAGTKITNVKAAILYWTGTADVVTRNFVSSWNATDVIPTFVSGMTAAIVSTSFAVTSVWTQFSLTSAQIPSTAKNVIVFIWNDRIDRLSTDELYLADVQLERGLVPTSFESLPLSMSETRCQRYLYAVYGNAPSGGAAYVYGPLNLATGPLDVYSKVFMGSIPFPQPMRAAPTGISKGLVSGSAYTVQNAGNVSVGLVARPQMLSQTPYLLQFSLGSAISTTLSAAITTTTQTTISVADNGAFPASGTIRIGNELIRYTGKSGSTSFTGCTRGAEGTTAATASNGSTVSNTFNSLPSGSYSLVHSGATPSYFIANAEL